MGRLLPWSLAAAAYAVASLVAMSDVVSSPGVLLTGLAQANHTRFLDRTDQQMVLATVTGNARRLVERPGAIRDEGQCYPLPRAYALGEHMFGEGLLAAPGWLLTQNPVFSYNSMLFLRLWIPAMAMFAFVLYVARNPWAAFLAGLLYGIHHYRVTDPVHPFVHGEMWLPIALLAVHRLFEGAGWVAAAVLGLAVSLTILESLYPLLAAAIFLGVYTLYLAARFPARLPHVIPRIGLALAMALVTAWWVLGPYLGLKDTWGVLQGVKPMFAFASDYLPREQYFPGAALLALAAIGLADRLRGARETPLGDPRVPLLLAGFVVFWCSVYYLPLWGAGLPSPLRMLIGIVPGLDSARSLVLVKVGILPALGALAGYGTLAVIERLRTGGRLALVMVIALVAMLETLHPAVQPLVYGHVPRFEGYEAGMSAYNRAFVSHVVPPVLDVPMRPGVLGTQAHFLLWAAYHGGSTAACYNSFPSPVQHATGEIASRLPDPAAARALSALGFATVVLHEELVGAGEGEDLATAFAADDGGLQEIARGGQHAVFRLEPETDVDASFEGLATASSPPGEVIEVASPTAVLPFTFTARTKATYRHPDPIQPTPLVLRWRSDATGRTVDAPTRGLLPLAIAAGHQAERVLAIPVEVPPGLYTVELSRSAQPDRPLSLARVRVVETS